MNLISLQEERRIRPQGYYSENKVQVGTVILLYSDIGLPISEIDDLHTSLQYILTDGRTHPFIITEINKENKTFRARSLTSGYRNMNDKTKQFYFELPKGCAENGLELKPGTAVDLYKITPELSFDDIFRICGNINRSAVQSLFKALDEHFKNPKTKFKTYENLINKE